MPELHIGMMVWDKISLFSLFTKENGPFWHEIVVKIDENRRNICQNRRNICQNRRKSGKIVGTPRQMCTNDENRDFRQKRALFTKENGPFFRDFSVVFIYICPKRAFFTKENGHFFIDFGDEKSQNVTFGRPQRNPEKIYIICRN